MPILNWWIVIALDFFGLTMILLGYQVYVLRKTKKNALRRIESLARYIEERDREGWSDPDAQ